jgi:hypothetical protein
MRISSRPFDKLNHLGSPSQDWPSASC